MQLIGHDERYVVEQSLMALFPGELPEYAPIAPEDTDWAVITLEQTAERGHVRVELTCRGKTAKMCIRDRFFTASYAMLNTALPHASHPTILRNRSDNYGQTDYGRKGFR